MGKLKRLQDVYRFPGFVPLAGVRGVFGDPWAVVITLRRRRKKRSAASAGEDLAPSTTSGLDACRDISCGDKRVYLALSVRRVHCPRCGGVKRERLDWLADNPLYTKRFAFFVGRRCRESTVQAVAEELLLDWHTVKELDKQYMREQLRRAGSPPHGSSASTRSPSARGTATASSSATWSGADRSGSAARTAPRRAWTSSSPGSARRNAGRSAWPSWTCGRRFATPPSRRATPRRPGSCTTSSTS